MTFLPPVLSVAACREADRMAIRDYGMPSIAMMENAGRGVAEEIMRRFPAARRVAILAGRGNNAGDGFVIARHLANAGRDARTILAAGVDFAGDAKMNFDLVVKMNLPVGTFGPEVLSDADVVVDALLGTGARGDVRPPLRDAILAANASGRPVVAVDIPSGLDGDTGAVQGVAVHAAVTATFIAPKPGFFRADGPAHTGEVVVVDIGIPRVIVETVGRGENRDA
ncbi:MAG: NAD(P)H-hydrate epimerase [Planctomycetota bacterium]